MADEPREIRGINWRETFPFIHLFRAFRVARHPSKLALALAALLLLYVGGRTLDWAWPAGFRAVPNEIQRYEQMRGQAGASAALAAWRERERENITQNYERELLRVEDLELDQDEARTLAGQRRHLSNVRRNIVADRDTRIERARERYEQQREGDGVREALDRSIRQAHAEANQRWHAARQIRGEGPFLSVFQYQVDQVDGVVRGVVEGNWLREGGALDSLLNFFRVGPIWAFSRHPVYFTIFTVFFLVVWAIFGGAISRIAAVDVARDEKLSVRSAMEFSVVKFLSFVFAPITPLLIILVVGIVIALGALLGNIPYVGPILVGLLFALVLIGGLIMTVILIGLVGGFNLMYPTVAVEGSDSFDAISRSFNYVYQRPWRFLFYTAVAVVYGALTYLFVRIFLWLLLVLSHYFVSWGLFVRYGTSEGVWQTMWPRPRSPFELTYSIDYLSLNWAESTGAFLVAFWVYLVVGLLGAFAISFYFSANTIIYFLLRREVDVTEMDDVYLEETDEDFGETEPIGAAAVTTTTVVTTEPESATEAPPESPSAQAPPAEPEASEPGPSSEVPPADEFGEKAFPEDKPDRSEDESNPPRPQEPPSDKPGT